MDSPGSISHAASPDEGFPRGERRFRRTLRGFVVALDPALADVPPECAACCAIAGASRIETRASDAARLIVPYCATCHERASQRGTRLLSLCVAACLAAFTLAGTLPVAFETLSLGVYIALVVSGPLFILFGAEVLQRFGQVGGRVRGRAVWWRADGQLACTNEAWATELARRNHRELRAADLERPTRRWLLWIAPAAAIGLSAFFYPFYHPRVRILNLTPGRLSIWVDGEPVAEVEPTSAESASAGAEPRISAGSRRIEARDAQGRVVTSVRVGVRSGAAHLFAPGSEGYCFWLQTTYYGRAQARAPEYVALSSDQRFWAFTEAIDSWFAPNPLPAVGDERSTGGTLTALRQAPCVEAPAAARFNPLEADAVAPSDPEPAATR